MMITYVPSVPGDYSGGGTDEEVSSPSAQWFPADHAEVPDACLSVGGGGAELAEDGA